MRRLVVLCVAEKPSVALALARSMSQTNGYKSNNNSNNKSYDNSDSGESADGVFETTNSEEPGAPPVHEFKGIYHVYPVSDSDADVKIKENSSNASYNNDNNYTKLLSRNNENSAKDRNSRGVPKTSHTKSDASTAVLSQQSAIGVHALFRITSVTGHVYNTDFVSGFDDWASVDPTSLFGAKTVKVPVRAAVPAHLQLCATGADALLLWTDCDREGENIAFEVLHNTLPWLNAPDHHVITHLTQVRRAVFSALAPSDVAAALRSMRGPDRHLALSVDARQELDLKLGAAFTRLQTMYLKHNYKLTGNNSSHNQSNDESSAITDKTASSSSTAVTISDVVNAGLASRSHNNSNSSDREQQQSRGGGRGGREPRALSEREPSVVSFGPCVTPTLGLVVERAEEIARFRPERYWCLQAAANAGDICIPVELAPESEIKSRKCACGMCSCSGACEGAKDHGCRDALAGGYGDDGNQDEGFVEDNRIGQLLSSSNNDSDDDDYEYDEDDDDDDYGLSKKKDKRSKPSRKPSRGSKSFDNNRITCYCTCASGSETVTEGRLTFSSNSGHSNAVTSPVAAAATLLPLQWQRGRVFSHSIAQALLLTCAPNATTSRALAPPLDPTSEDLSIAPQRETILSAASVPALIIAIMVTPHARARPLPLNTVSLLKVASRGLGLGPAEAMAVAESLYMEGFISYPRTETQAYPRSFAYNSVLAAQRGHGEWGAVAAGLLQSDACERCREWGRANGSAAVKSVCNDNTVAVNSDKIEADPEKTGEDDQSQDLNNTTMSTSKCVSSVSDCGHAWRRTRARMGFDSGDHPPITPTTLTPYTYTYMSTNTGANTNDSDADNGAQDVVVSGSVLRGARARVYEYIVRHFLATLLPDCTTEATQLTLTLPYADSGTNTNNTTSLVPTSTLREKDVTAVQGERFTITSLAVTALGHTALLPWLQPRPTPYALAASDLRSRVGTYLTLPRVALPSAPRLTAPPALLTESELIALMEHHGIGTDATIPVHIANLSKRGFAALAPGTV